jgi:hypothetical protein
MHGGVRQPETDVGESECMNVRRFCQYSRSLITRLSDNVPGEPLLVQACITHLKRVKLRKK